MIPFGWTNVLATFQSYIHKILAEKLDVFIVIYLDDIFISIKSKKEKQKEAV